MIDSNTKKGNSCNGYVSCIKIAGVSLLPPIITPERRVELQNDKRKAIEIERRLTFQRDLQEFLKHYKLDENYSPFDVTSCDKILDNLLFDNDISHVEALNIISPSPSKIVPLLNKNQSFYQSEPIYSNVCDNSEIIQNYEVVQRLAASSVELNLSDITFENSLIVAQNSDQYEYQLARSKTFVLPAPSPVLLKHLRERPHTSPAILKKVLDDLDTTDNVLDTILCINLQEANETSQVTLTDGKNISFVSKYDYDLPFSTLKEVVPEHNVNYTNTVEESPATSEYLNDDLQICLDLLNLDFTNKNNHYADVLPLVGADLSLPLENQSVVESYTENEQSLLDSQSLIFNNNDTLSTSTPNLIDFDSDNCNSEAVNNTKENVEVLTSAVSPLDYPNVEIIANVFHSRLDKEQRRIKEQWAAGVLTAAAKGYLVRRLKRTERVQHLIQTIRDALVCALSLHTESCDSIQNSDVELHRRLIQQISAACYEFYEVFFSLTTKEKMDLIAIDRQRIQEKIKKPKSATNLKLESTKSTPKTQRRSFSTRQRKSLTPTFAA